MNERAHLNPAILLLIMECADYVSAKLNLSKLTPRYARLRGRQSIYSILWQGIIFMFSENENIINKVIATYSALPGGYRNNNNGNFKNIGNNANFWSSSENNNNNAWNRKLNYNNSEVNRNNNNKKNGFSVRCIRYLHHLM